MIRYCKEIKYQVPVLAELEQASLLDYRFIENSAESPSRNSIETQWLAVIPTVCQEANDDLYVKVFSCTFHA